MADGLNRVELIGNIGQIELRNTQGGQPVLNFSLATSESWFDEKSKERKERTEWHRCNCWGKRGEGLNKILTKGSRIFVEGRLQTRSWEKDGQKHYATEINVTNVILCGGKSRDRQDDDRGQQHGSGGGGYEDHGQAGGEFDDSSIPF
jgi:single-strand DNA-binding protein